MERFDLPHVAGVISDLDGVVYRGTQPIPSAVVRFCDWWEQGVPYCFVTNNSTRSPEEVAAKLTAMGVPTEADQVVTSAVMTAEVMARRWPEGGTAFVIGAPALAEAVADAGFSVATDRADAVVVGLDRDFTYAKLDRAMQLIRGGATLIATNPDRILPDGDRFEPGNGAIVAAIAAAGGTAPLVIGKPERHLVDEALARLAIPPERAILIGDQLATDIAAARAAGVYAILVETGVEQLEGAGVADLRIPDLSALPDFGPPDGA